MGSLVHTSLFFLQVAHGTDPPSFHTWVFSSKPGFASSTQVSNPKEILDLQIKRGSSEAVPIFLDFAAGKITGWAERVDKELSDADFVGYLECAGILKSITMTRNLEGFRDVKGLKHLVRRWSPSFHTFFFSVGERIVTLEAMVNTFLLLMFGNESPFNIQFSVGDLVVEEKLFMHFGGRTASLGGKPARMGRWVKALFREEKSVR